MFFLLYSGKCNLHFNLNSHDDGNCSYEKYLTRLLKIYGSLSATRFSRFYHDICNNFYRSLGILVGSERTNVPNTSMKSKSACVPNA